MRSRKMFNVTVATAGQQTIYTCGSRSAVVSKVSFRKYSAYGAVDREECGKFPVGLALETTKGQAIEQALDFVMYG